MQFNAMFYVVQCFPVQDEYVTQRIAYDRGDFLPGLQLNVSLIKYLTLLAGYRVDDFEDFLSDLYRINLSLFPFESLVNQPKSLYLGSF